MKTFVRLFLALIVVPASAQSSMQFRIDTTVTTYVVMEQGDVTPDGNVWAVLNAEVAKVLWKGTAEGEPLWAATLDSVDTYSYMAALPNGGCMLAAKLPSIVVPSGGGIDTFRVGFTITALHADGQLHWRRKVTTDLRSGDTEGSGFRVLRTRPAPDGNIYILADIALGSVFLNTPCVYKFSPEGALVWSRKFGAPYLNSYLRWGYGTWDLLPAPDGGGYLYAGTGLWPSEQRILRFDSDGDIVWNKRHDLDLFASHFEGAFVDAAGNAVLVGGIDNDDQAVLLQLDAQGDVAIGSYYSGLNAWTGFLGGAAQGLNSVLYTTAQEVLVVDAAGEVVTAVETTDTVVEPFRYSFTRGDFRIQNDRVVLFGNGGVRDMDMEFLDSYGHVWSFSTEVIDGCMMQRFTPTRTDVETADMVILTDTNFLSVDAGAIVVPDPYTTTARAPFGTTPTCSVFLSTAIPAATSAPALTVAQANGSLQVTAPQDALLSVVDAHGRLVVNAIPVHGGVAQHVALHNAQAGLYVVRVCTPAGVCASQRVVVH